MKRLTLMKVISLCLLWGIYIPAGAQTNTLAVKKMRIDSITAIGKPNGEKVSEEIGKSGGTIFSEDGRVELIFPEGALPKKKKITIQPVENRVANGQGNAYQFEPSGLQFEKPVTLVFHFEGNELSGQAADLKGLAWQDEKGKWQGIPDISIDTAAKKITAQINHFSSYSAFDKIVLKPEHARVKVEKSIHMEIHFVSSDLDNDIALPPTITAPEWTVNGITYGNSNVGRISPINNIHAKYTAPASVPDENPVAVSAKLTGMEFTFNKKTFKNISLVSHLLIYDKAYRISMDVWVDNTEDGMCTLRCSDHGEFTLVLEGTRAMMKEISNQNLQIRLNPCPCPAIWLNRPVAGPINTLGPKRIDVTPASLPGTPFRKIRIMLNHGISQLPRFTTSCPAKQPMPPTTPMAFLPPVIEFEAKDDPEQKITLSELTMGAEQNKRKYGVIITIKLIEENNK